MRNKIVKNFEMITKLFILGTSFVMGHFNKGI